MREKWVDDKTFTDLFALGSALPGPSFSQVIHVPVGFNINFGLDLLLTLFRKLAFSIALFRGGFVPALLSFVLLTYATFHYIQTYATDLS